MLQIFRRHSKSVMKTILVFFAAVMMMSFGVDYFSRKENREVAARVNNTEITFTQVNSRKDEIHNMLRQRLGNNYEALKNIYNIDEQAINTLINEVVIRQFITQLGYNVETRLVEDQIRREIEAIPQLGGKFTLDNYRLYLRLRNMSEVQLEAVVKTQMLNAVLRGILSDFSYLSKQELMTLLAINKSTYSFLYGELPVIDFETQVDVNNKEKLLQYYQDHQEDFRRQRAINYSYVEFLPVDYKNKVELTDSDLEMLYENKKESFKTPKKVHLRQIKISKLAPTDQPLAKMLGVQGNSSSDQTEQENKKTEEIRREFALNVKARLNNGEDFSKVASELSDDLNTKSQGGDLGWKEIKELPEVVRAAANKLTQGNMSEIVNSPDAYYILYGEEIIDAQYKPFESVKSQVEDEIRTQNAFLYARNDAFDFANSVSAAIADNKQSFEQFAQSQGKKVVTPDGLFEKGQSPSPDQRGLTDALINTAEGVPSFTEVGSKLYVTYVNKIKDSHIPQFEEIQEEVSANYRQVTADELSKAKASSILAKLQSSINNEKTPEEVDALVNSVLQAEGLEVKEISFSREEPQEGLFEDPELVTSLFMLTKDSRVATEPLRGQDAYTVVVLKDITSAPENELTQNLKSIEASEKEAAETRLYQLLLANLKANSEIWIDPSILEKKNQATSL